MCDDNEYIQNFQSTGWLLWLNSFMHNGFRTCVFPIIDFDDVKYRNEKLYIIEKSVENLEMKLSSASFILAIFSTEKVRNI